MSKFLKIIFLFSILLHSCSSSDDATPDPEDIQVEVSFFIYTPQVGTTPDRLQYEIIFTNPNDIGVIGFYHVTTRATFGEEVVEAAMLSTNNSVCYEIEANSSCVFSYDETGDINIGTADSIEFVSATYAIDSTF